MPVLSLVVLLGSVLLLSLTPVVLLVLMLVVVPLAADEAVVTAVPLVASPLVASPLLVALSQDDGQGDGWLVWSVRVYGIGLRPWPSFLTRVNAA